jgi:hypothetical protein
MRINELINDYLSKQGEPYNDYSVVDTERSPSSPSIPQIFVNNTTSQYPIKIDLSLEDLANVYPSGIISEVQLDLICQKIKTQIHKFAPR